MFLLILTAVLCFQQSKTFDMGPAIFINATKTKMMTMKYPETRRMAAHFDGRYLSYRPVITMHDATRLSHLETFELLTSVKDEYSMHLGLLFQPHTTMNCIGFLNIIPLMDTDTIINTIIHKYHKIICPQSKQLHVIIGAGTFDVPELNVKIGKFAPSSIIIHPSTSDPSPKKSIIIHYILDTQFCDRKEYAFWRQLSVKHKNKFIVFGCHSHNIDGCPHVISSQFSQYEHAFQVYHDAERILADKTNDSSLAATKKIFWIKSSWMDSVYATMRATKRLQPNVTSFNINDIDTLQSLHNRSYRAWHIVSKKFHELCTDPECESKDDWFRAMSGYLQRLNREERMIEKKLLAIDDGIRTAMLKSIIKMIECKFNAYAKANRFESMLWVVVAKEIIKKFTAHFDEFETLHVVIYCRRSAGFMEMERMISRSIPQSTLDVYERQTHR